MNVEFNVKDLVYTAAFVGFGYFLNKTNKKLSNVDRNSFRAYDDFRKSTYREFDDIWKQINLLKPKEAKK